MVYIVIRLGITGVHIPSMVIKKTEVNPFPSTIQRNITVYLRDEKRISTAVGIFVLIRDGTGEHLVTRAVFYCPVRKAERPVSGSVCDANNRYPVPIRGALLFLVDPFLVVVCLLEFIA